MFKNRFITLFSGDFVALIFFLYISFAIFQSFVMSSVKVENMLSIHSFILIIFSLMSSLFFEIYDGRKKYGSKELVTRIGAMSLLSFILPSVLYSFDQITSDEYKIYALTICCFSLFQILWHGINHGFFIGKFLGKRVVILGNGALAHNIGEIVSKQSGPYDFLGYISCGTQADVDPSQIVGQAESLVQIVKNKKADTIVVSLRERRGNFPSKDLLECKMSGINVLDAPAFYEKITGKLLIENITPSGLIFSDGFRITPIMLVFKRLLDITMSFALLTLVLPFIPIFALVIMLDSPGSVFFSQVRVGERGSLFKVYKFRTMRTDAESATGAIWSQKGDPRITRVGRLYRKLRIDEIPQLWNIICGDMSFVGPRPERPQFVEKLSEEIPYYSERHTVKPGLTGWAQVSYPYGSSVEDAKEKLRYDMYYIKNYSLFFDFYIILKTVRVILLGGGR